MCARTLDQAPARDRPARRYELDWLRVLIVLGLIPIHAANIFASAPDIFLKNPETSDFFVVLGTFVGVFGMPVLFLVSGAASWYALGQRTPGAYVWERLTRLLVPLVFATLAIVPIQVYIVLRSNPEYATILPVHISDPHYLDSFVRFYPYYLAGYLYFLGHPSVTGMIVFFGPLWFILCLLAFSLGSLPLLLYLRSEGGKRLIAAAARLCEPPGAILLGGLAVSLAEAGLHAAVPALGSLAELGTYLLFFVLGYCLYAEPRLVQAIRQAGPVALPLALVGWAAAQILVIGGRVSPYDNSMGYVLFVPLRSILAWLWVVALLGIGMRFLAVGGRQLDYLRDATLPIYVLHVALIVMIGSYIVPWAVGIVPKYLIIVLASTAALFTVYDLLIKRWWLTRLLFGLRLPRYAAHSPSATTLFGRLQRAGHDTPGRS